MNPQKNHLKEVGVSSLPEWAVNANIYEVNIRQYTVEGTLNAFLGHVPRLKKMGVEILWFMPVYPISSTKKKGLLGSYYAVSDFKSINPEFGTLSDFKKLVQKIHDVEMKVILDWVPNHTGWDHRWIKEHPGWYTHVGDVITHPYDLDGKPTDWYDVAELNYNNLEMRKEMQSCMEYWVREHDIDGYRCDMAFFVPDEFWHGTIQALRTLKPLFMLAEAEHPPIREDGLFNCSYAWEFHHLLNEVAIEKKSAKDIDEYLERTKNKFPAGFQMYFTSNHDENSWKGSSIERMGEAYEALAVLVSTMDGIPLLYSGQEAGNKKRLKFFEKDAIDWTENTYSSFYSKLLKLKTKNKALWNGDYGGHLQRLLTGEDQYVFAFTREKDGHSVIVVLNLCGTSKTFKLNTSAFQDNSYKNLFENKFEQFETQTLFAMQPWEYLVWSKE